MDALGLPGTLTEKLRRVGEGLREAMWLLPPKEEGASDGRMLGRDWVCDAGEIIAIWSSESLERASTALERTAGTPFSRT